MQITITKKLKAFLETQEALEKFLIQLTKQHSNCNIYFANDIDNNLWWDETDEGHPFWSNLHRRYDDYYYDGDEDECLMINWQ